MTLHTLAITVGLMLAFVIGFLVGGILFAAGEEAARASERAHELR